MAVISYEDTEARTSVVFEGFLNLQVSNSTWIQQRPDNVEALQSLVCGKPASQIN